MNTNKLKGQVEYILMNDVESRNSDITLTIAIWKRFYSSKIKKSEATGELGVYLKDLFDLPREDNIKRIRAYFQNDKMKYLPTSLEVVKQRKMNEEVWRKMMSMPDAHARLKKVIEM